MNQIGDEGVKAFAASLPSCALTSVGIYNAHITYKGISAMAEALPLSSINSLFITDFID